MEKTSNRSQVESKILDENVARVVVRVPADTSVNAKAVMLIDYLFWVVVAVILLRFAFKIIGANSHNAFVSLIYGLTSPAVGVFSGIVEDVISNNMVIEFASPIAIIVLWLIYRAVLRLVAIVR